MSTITVGVPVYKGTETVAAALQSLVEQSFGDFEVIISVDGNDLDTAEACRPFLSDPRFRMVIQPERLDWFGNLNWLLQQPMGEFFCYRQHDDTTTPDFFERLVGLARSRPDAAAVYADCQWRGGRSDIEIAPSIEGAVFHRMTRFIEDLQPVPVRGLIRRQAIAQAGLIRSDEFRGLCEVFVWLAKVLRWGHFLRLAQPLYFRLDHADNYHKQWHDWPEEKKRAAWTTMFTGLREAILPVCATKEEQLFFLQVILDRVVVPRAGRPHLYVPPTAHSAGALIGECFKRLADEAAAKERG